MNVNNTLAIINLTKEDSKELQKSIDTWGSNIYESGWHRIQGKFIREGSGGPYSMGATIWHINDTELKECQKNDILDCTGDIQKFIKLFN